MNTIFLIKLIKLILIVADVTTQAPRDPVPRETFEQRRIEVLVEELVDIEVRVYHLRAQVNQTGNEDLELLEVREELNRIQRVSKR